MGYQPGQGTQYPKVYLADLLGLLNVDGLQPRAAGTQGARCLKSFLAGQMGLLNVDGLQTRAAGAQGMQCLKAFLAPVLGILNADALQTQAAGTQGTQYLKAFLWTSWDFSTSMGCKPGQGTQCLKALLADQLGLLDVYEVVVSTLVDVQDLTMPQPPPARPIRESGGCAQPCQRHTCR